MESRRGFLKKFFAISAGAVVVGKISKDLLELGEQIKHNLDPGVYRMPLKEMFGNFGMPYGTATGMMAMNTNGVIINENDKNLSKHNL